MLSYIAKYAKSANYLASCPPTQVLTTDVESRSASSGTMANAAWTGLTAALIRPVTAASDLRSQGMGTLLHPSPPHTKEEKLNLIGTAQGHRCIDRNQPTRESLRNRLGVRRGGQKTRAGSGGQGQRASPKVQA